MSHFTVIHLRSYVFHRDLSDVTLHSNSSEVIFHRDLSDVTLHSDSYEVIFHRDLSDFTLHSNSFDVPLNSRWFSFQVETTTIHSV